MTSNRQKSFNDGVLAVIPGATPFRLPVLSPRGSSRMTR